MIEILADQEVQGMILGTPVYFGTMSAQYQALLDQAIVFRRNDWLLRDKVGGVLAVRRVRNGGAGTDPAGRPGRYALPRQHLRRRRQGYRPLRSIPRQRRPRRRRGGRGRPQDRPQPRTPRGPTGDSSCTHSGRANTCSLIQLPGKLIF
ncbi:MAG: flavodoxin family protein [Pirellulales bacterium]|nr:flavodoxin family protein [Pirellulales bacterium]